jgi:nicotinate phosphoribosyltransferase
MLGILARASRIATNTYKAITATRGKPITFMAARFDHPSNQPLDGYAYTRGLLAYSRRTGIETTPLVTTRAHARNWGREDGSGMSHSYVLCFLRDTPEAMLQYARLAPPEVARVAVVDANNDCVADSVETARRMFEQYQRLLDDGRPDEANRYRLFAVRPDTSRNMRDRQIEPLGDPRLDCGVTPRLVHLIREALDQAPLHMNVPLSWMDSCRRYFREIKIFVTGGFDPKRIRLFEDLQVPVDLYGIGSYLVRGKTNDYTADVVEVEVGEGRWMPMAKAGRGPRESPQLRDFVPE